MLRLCILLVLGCCFIVGQKPIFLAPQQQDLKKIPDDREMKTEFALHNNSENTIVIEKIETSCGCTSVIPKTREIASQQHVPIEVLLDPRGRKGPMTWEIRLYTNSPEVPILIATIDCFILKAGILSHDSVLMGEFPQDYKQTKKIWLSPPDQPDFKILEISELGDQKNFDWEITSCVHTGFYPAPRKAYCITITPKPDIPCGVIHSSLEITTDIPDHSKITIPISAKVLGDLGYTPDYVALGIIRNSSQVSRNIYIYTRNDKDFHITETNIPFSFISVKFTQMIPLQYYKMQITCDPSKTEHIGEFRGEITLTTSSQLQPLLKIPVQGFIRK